VIFLATNKSQNNYHFAALDSEQMEALRKIEAKLKIETGKEIVILAYEKDKY